MFRVITDAKEFREYVLLRDGQGVLLRTATPADLPMIHDMLSGVSRESLRMRFMGSMKQAPAKFVDGLCSEDPHDRACLLAVMGEEPEAKVVGFGNYVSLGARNTADVAFIVADEYQGRGISTLLLERLAGIAAGVGFVGFEADVLFENQQMTRVFRDSGFEARQVLDGGNYHVEFPVSGAAALLERAELRERTATANSMARLLRPRVVAVVGASREQTSVGSRIFQHILENNFTGTVYPVNHQAVSVHGVRSYPSVAQLPEPPDLVVVAVPAESVVPVAEEAVHAGAKGLIVVASGFAEIGEEGAALQRRLVDLVRSNGARLVGPNCLGLLNTDPAISLNASLASTMPPVGRIGFFSHSAALGIVILQYAGERGLGFSTFVSAGNRADVSGTDVLEYWEEDPATDIAMLYLEAFGNPRRFGRVARRVSSRKPVLCVKGARSRAGFTAAGAHIGAAPVGDVEVDALFHQAGVTRVDTLEELFDVALLLAHQPLPGGDRVAILSNSGGVVTITADACDAYGLNVSKSGLIDLGPQAGAEDYRAAVQRALEDPQVDAVIAIFLCVGECDPELVARGIRRGVIGAEHANGVTKPVLLSMMGATGVVKFAFEGRGALADRKTEFPSYRFPEAAARALAHAVAYAAYRREPPGRLVWYEGTDPARAHAVIEAAMRDHPADAGPHSLTRQRASEILGCFGIAVAAGAPRRDEAPRIELRVRQHHVFGPIVMLGRAGQPAVVRITPLTDQDARGMLKTVGLPPDGEEVELLCRLSQLIEELPWLAELNAELEAAIDGSHAALGGGLRVAVTRPAGGPRQS
jgi:acyl-CoA synthetase (NDP forming)/GNAT superfamily N-acetyltransferase